MWFFRDITLQHWFFELKINNRVGSAKWERKVEQLFFRRSTRIKSRAWKGGRKWWKKKKTKEKFVPPERCIASLCIEPCAESASGHIVGSSFTWNFLARPDRFKASIRGHLRRPTRGACAHHAHARAWCIWIARAGSRCGERVIESGEIILLLLRYNARNVSPPTGETDFHAINHSYRLHRC